MFGNLTTAPLSHRHLASPSQDPVPPELIGLLQNSDNALLHQIFTDKETENPTTRGLSKVTVVSKFKVRAICVAFTLKSFRWDVVVTALTALMSNCRTLWRA